MLSEKDLKELRHNLAHLSLGAVRDFYEQAYRDCRLIYSRLPARDRCRHSCRCGSSCGSGADDMRRNEYGRSFRLPRGNAVEQRWRCREKSRLRLGVRGRNDGLLHCWLLRLAVVWIR